MIDPREDKLPKWAQETILRERRSGLVSPPPFERPAPDYQKRNSLFFAGERPVMKWVYGVAAGHRGAFTTYRRFAGKDTILYDNEKCEGFGSRADGVFWFSEGDARKEVAWRTADHSAKRLYEAYLLAGVWS